jgi:hypothetical protein
MIKQHIYNFAFSSPAVAVSKMKRVSHMSLLRLCKHIFVVHLVPTSLNKQPFYTNRQPLTPPQIYLAG